MVADEQEKASFYDLIRSIAKQFIPIDPIVVWKDDKGRFCVAEGNRRVLALKLLLDPNKAPKGIRRFVRELSGSMPEKITKIKVLICKKTYIGLFIYFQKTYFIFLYIVIIYR